MRSVVSLALGLCCPCLEYAALGGEESESERVLSRGGGGEASARAPARVLEASPGPASGDSYHTFAPSSATSYTSSHEDGSESSEGEEEFLAKYEQREVIGVGSSSKVFRCVRRSDGREFAVKVVNFSALSQHYPDKALRRLTREAASLRVLDHEGIVRMEDSFAGDGKMYIVEELLQGGELYDRIAERKGLPEREARVVFAQVARALLHMHRNKVMHRDIKPENVLLVDKQSLRVKLIDFGFSKAVRGAHSGSFLGTGGFLAPELRLPGGAEGAAKQRYTNAVDVWALGCLLFVMVSGRMPFDDSLYQRPAREVTVRFVPDRVWARVSRPAKKLIRGMLEADPGRRLNMEEVVGDPWVALADAPQPQRRGPSVMSGLSLSISPPRSEPSSEDAASSGDDKAFRGLGLPAKRVAEAEIGRVTLLERDVLVLPPQGS
jgi:serine/threonine protein kinase